MKRIPLKSKFGCDKCKQRRKKCDETKPGCGDCARLGLVCRYTALDCAHTITEKHACSSTILVPHTTTLVDAEPSKASSSNGGRAAGPRNEVVLTFDRPSILRTDAVPSDGTPGCKLILQYLSERGTSVLRVPVALPIAKGEINLFRAGYQMAAQSSTSLQAYLCMGAGSLARLVPAFNKIALKYYTLVMSTLREELMADLKKPPAEWTCAVAAILSFYELIAFHSPESRLAHLIGFHRLMELRFQMDLEWSPLKMLPEQYIHSLTIGSLFHKDLLVGQKSITHVEDIVSKFDDSVRPLGPEIAGVPGALTSVVYRLAVLNSCDVNESPWDIELAATASRLASWTPSAHALQPCAAGLLLMAQLYQLACNCLLQNILDRTADGTHLIIETCLKEADDLLEAFPFREQVFNGMIWPLTILAIFAVDPLQRFNFRRPITVLVEIGGVEGYRSILSFLELITKENIGPQVFQRPDLLGMVFM